MSDPAIDPTDTEELSSSWACPICGATETKRGKSFGSAKNPWMSVRSHMISAHKNDVKGQMITEEDILDWDPDKFGMVEEEEEDIFEEESTVSPGATIPMRRLPDVFQELSKYLGLYGVDSTRLIRITDYMKTSGKSPDNLFHVYDAMKYGNVNNADMKLLVESWANKRHLRIPDELFDELFDDDDTMFGSGRRRRDRSRRSDDDWQTRRDITELKDKNKELGEQIRDLVSSMKSDREEERREREMERRYDREEREKDRLHEKELRERDDKLHAKDLEHQRKMSDATQSRNEDMQWVEVITKTVKDGMDGVGSRFDKTFSKLLRLAEPMSGSQAPNLTQMPEREGEELSVADLVGEEYIARGF